MQSLTGLKILAIAGHWTDVQSRDDANAWVRYDQVEQAAVASIKTLLNLLRRETGWRSVTASCTDLLEESRIYLAAGPVRNLLKWRLMLALHDRLLAAFAVFSFFNNDALFRRPVMTCRAVVLAMRQSPLQDLKALLLSSGADFILLDREKLDGVQCLMLLVASLHAHIPVMFVAPKMCNAKLRIAIEAKAMRAASIRRRGSIKSISEIYGARQILSRYTGLPEERLRFRAHWMHGWIPAFQNVHPAFIALHKTEKIGIGMRWRRDRFDKRLAQWVCREDQAVFLRQHGYSDVGAVGHPLSYACFESLSYRLPGSLLLVPPHGGGHRGERDALVLRYVEFIQSIRREFSEVCLCVTVADYLARNWWPVFEKIGVETIVSVERSHPFALDRMMGLLSRFEFVTTNGFGSVIAYASLAGCKVSISGPYAELPQELLKKAHAVMHHPELLQTQIDICSETMMRHHYPELFCLPQESLCRIAWAEQELGFSCRRSPEWMRAALCDGFSSGP